MSTENAVRYFVEEFTNRSDEEQNGCISDYYDFLLSSEGIEDPYNFWMEYIKTDPKSLFYLEGLLRAMKIMRYGIWAINRFTIHGSQEWSDNIHHEVALRQKIASLEKMVQELKMQANQDQPDKTLVDP